MDPRLALRMQRQNLWFIIYDYDYVYVNMYLFILI